MGSAEDRGIGMGMLGVGLVLDTAAVGLLVYGLGVLDGAALRPVVVGGAAFLFTLSSGAVVMGAMRLRT